MGSETKTLNDRLIAEQIAVLLSHFWTPEMSAEIRSATARDWLSDLTEFPAHVVKSACQEWRRGNEKAPKIANIRGLCKEMAPRPEPHRSPPAPQIARVRVEPTTVRDNWRTLPYRELSEAERGLFKGDLKTVPISGEAKKVLHSDTPLDPRIANAKLTPDRLAYLVSLLPPL